MTKTKPYKLDDLYRKLAHQMFWSLIMSISLLTYIVEIRPFFDSQLGIYCVGLFDGIFGTIIVLVIALYLASKKR